MREHIKPNSLIGVTMSLAVLIACERMPNFLPSPVTPTVVPVARVAPPTHELSVRNSIEFVKSTFNLSADTALERALGSDNMQFDTDRIPGQGNVPEINRVRLRPVVAGRNTVFDIERLDLNPQVYKTEMLAQGILFESPDKKFLPVPGVDLRWQQFPKGPAVIYRDGFGNSTTIYDYTDGIKVIRFDQAV